MITNETRAKLIGVPANAYFKFDTDANAASELRAFVRARGKMRTFVAALIKVLHDEWRSEDRDHRAGFTETRFDLIDATPAQQTAAFDATFKDELERIQ